VQAFLDAHANVRLHLTPTYSSWLNPLGEILVLEEIVPERIIQFTIHQSLRVRRESYCPSYGSRRKTGS